MVETLREPLHQSNGNGRMTLPVTRLEFPTHRLASRLAEQESAGWPVRILEESDYVPVLQERNDVPILVASRQHGWQPKPPSLAGNWPLFLSVFSSFCDESLHKHLAVSHDGVPDQVEVYVVLSGVARLFVPHGQGKVAVSRLLPHSVAIVYPGAYHYVAWDEPGYGLVFRSPNYGRDAFNAKVIWSDGDGR